MAPVKPLNKPKFIMTGEGVTAPHMGEALVFFPGA